MKQRIMGEEDCEKRLVGQGRGFWEGGEKIVEKARNCGRVKDRIVGEAWDYGTIGYQKIVG